MINSKLYFFVILLFVYSAAFPQYDWNNGGGNPERNGLSPAPGPTTDSLLWQDNAAGLFGMPCYIEDNMLVTMRFMTMTNSPVTCYDIHTGVMMWQKDVTGFTGRSVPVGVRNGKVYVMGFRETLHDSLYALDINTGEKVWTANSTYTPWISSSVSFADNGDLLVEKMGFISRINHANGEAVWNCPAYPFVIGHLEMAVNHDNNTGYILESIGMIPYITAIDLTTGTKKYNHILNETNPGGGLQQAPIMVGNNGVIYAHKQGDNITALLDNGASLEVLWETPITGNAPFSHTCIGADGSVYAPDYDKIIRIDPSDGAIRNTSGSVVSNPELFQLRLSASQNNLVFATNGENRLYAFDLELNVLWSTTIPNVNTSGAAIGANGLIAVTGTNTVRVYAAASTVDIAETKAVNDLEIFPNPCIDRINIEAGMAFHDKPFILYDEAGRTVRSGLLDPGVTLLDLETLKPGTYFLVSGSKKERIIKGAH